MAKKLSYSLNLLQSIVFVALFFISNPFCANALESNDPNKVCELYGCDKGIPITGPQPSPTTRPDNPASPRPGNAAARFCAYYEDVNFGGKRGWLLQATESAYVGKKWNDRISSISCSPGCTLIAYEHQGFQGETREFPGSTPFVGADWNDRISSLRIRCQ